MDFILSLITSIIVLYVISLIADFIDAPYAKKYSKSDRIIMPKAPKKEVEQLLIDDELIRKYCIKMFSILICTFILSQPCFAFTKWEDSPYNWNNAEHNWQNSSSNWKNSPGNWNNSRYNPNANIIYNSQGQAQGYAVPKQNGTGVNVYDFNGKRQGYYNY